MNWSKVKLSRIVEINPRNREWVGLDEDSEITFVPMSAIAENTAAIEVPEIRRIKEVRRGYTSFREGDVLFAKITPCMENGKAALATKLINGFGFGSTEFHVLRAKGLLLPKFLYYFVRQSKFRLDAKQRMQGAVGQQRVPEDFLANYLLPLPSPSEQWRIVEILDQADALRKKRAEADAKAERILPALFIKMFGDPATNPKKWNEVSVSEFIERFESGRSIVAKGQGDNISKYRVLKVSAVTWGKYQPEESKPIPPDYNPPENHFVKAGDLLFSRANTRELVGAVAYVYDTPPNLLLPDKLWRFVWRNPNEVEPLYIYSLFSHPSVRYELGKRATGTSGSMQNISMGKVLSMKVPFPLPEIQHRFAETAKAAQAVELQREKSHKRIEALFQKLLHTAFTGDLTAKWREAHMKELLAEMELQRKELDAAASQTMLPL